jgi:hypothetical protein
MVGNDMTPSLPLEHARGSVLRVLRVLLVEARVCCTRFDAYVRYRHTSKQ